MAKSHLRVLEEKVDAFFERVYTRYASDIQCGSGCADCCHAELTVTGAEAEAVSSYARALPDEVRSRLRARAAQLPEPHSPRCAALGEDNRCEIYEARPLFCRSHGVPIRTTDPESGGSRVGVCHRNFAGRSLETVDTSCVLDQQTLSATLLAINRLANSEEPGARVHLRDVLRQLP